MSVACVKLNVTPFFVVLRAESKISSFFAIKVA